MAFSSSQIRKLQRDVKAVNIRRREVHGRELSYIEGWHAIDEANRIFGFDGWNRETVESRCVSARENRGSFHVLYVARVKVTVRADSDQVIREGFGTGDAQAESLGEAHDKAIKTAETDATKRALATFGKPFGLSLYLGVKRRQPQATPDIQRRRTLQRLGPNGRYHVVPPPKPPSVVQMLAPFPAQSVEPEKELEAPANARFSAQPSDPARLKTDGLMIERTKRKRAPEHLRFVSAQPCLVCSRRPSDAHHLKFAQPRAMASKVSDEFTVPLCRTHHRQVHQGGNEVAWWIDMDIDPLPIANELWDQSHGVEKPQPANGQDVSKETERQANVE
jgi:DNA recombination protein Rad52